MIIAIAIANEKIIFINNNISHVAFNTVFCVLQMRSLLINAMDSVSTNIQNFDQLVGSSDVLNSVTEVPEEVTVESRATAANAMNNSAAAASAVGEDASVDQVSDMTVGKFTCGVIIVSLFIMFYGIFCDAVCMF